MDNGNWWVDFIENYADNTEDYLNECTQMLELTIDRNEWSEHDSQLRASRLRY